MGKQSKETPAETPADATTETVNEQSVDEGQTIEQTEEQAQADQPIDKATKRQIDGYNLQNAPRPDQQNQDESGDAEDESDTEAQEEQAESEDSVEEQAAVAIPGVEAADAERYAKEFVENGKLSDASFAELEEAGYPRDIVETYLAGSASQGEQNARSFYEVFGDRNVYENQVIPWAQQNLSPESIDAFDEVLKSGDWPKARDAAQKLYDEYIKDQGTPAGFKVTGHKTDTPSGTQPFRSAAELRKAIASEEYKTSHAYRVEVQHRAEASRKMGIRLS